MVKKQKISRYIKENYSKVEFWDKAYRTGDTPWDLGGPTPIFTDWINSVKDKKKICVLGAGNGWDAFNFAEKGHDVTAVDFAPSAINNMHNLAKKKSIDINLLQKNIFDLPIKFKDYFDVVVEYTCFCAIDPSDRGRYLEVVEQILAKSGLFVGILFPIDGRSDMSGPPFNIDSIKILKLFNKYFLKDLFVKSEHSISPRKEREMFFIFRKK